MAQIRGYCQRICNECTIFQATLHDDDYARAELAATLSETYDKPFRLEDINCDGCKAEDDRLFLYARDCSVRNREIQDRS